MFFTIQYLILKNKDCLIIKTSECLWMGWLQAITGLIDRPRVSWQRTDSQRNEWWWRDGQQTWRFLSLPSLLNQFTDLHSDTQLWQLTASSNTYQLNAEERAAERDVNRYGFLKAERAVKVSSAVALGHKSNVAETSGGCYWCDLAWLVCSLRKLVVLGAREGMLRQPEIQQ